MKSNHYLVLRAAHFTPSANPCGLQVADVDAGCVASDLIGYAPQRTRQKRIWNVPQRAR